MIRFKSNIFGRTSPLDWAHMAFVHDHFGPEEMEVQIRLRERMVGKPLQLPDRQYDLVSNKDASILGYVTDNQTHLVMEAEHWLYRKTKYTELIPVKSDIPFGTQAVRYEVFDRSGEGDFLDEGGKSVNYVSVDRRSPSYSLRYAGIGVKYNYHEMAASMLSNSALNPKLMQAAVEGAIKQMQRAWFEGLANEGGAWRYGILNQPTNPNVDNHVSLTTSTDGAWSGASAATPHQILEVVQSTIDRIQDDEEIVGGQLQGTLCIVMPPSLRKIIKRRPLSESYPTRSIWSYIMENNTWPDGFDVKLMQLAECKGAGVGGTDRILSGVLTDDVLEAAVSRMPTPRAPQIVEAEVKILLDYAFAPVYTKYPIALDYLDIPKP